MRSLFLTAFAGVFVAVILFFASGWTSSGSAQAQSRSRSYAQQMIQFNSEARDPDWASSTERAISDEVAALEQPKVKLISAECRQTMCMLNIYYERDPGPERLDNQLAGFESRIPVKHRDYYELEEVPDGLGLKISQFLFRQPN